METKKDLSSELIVYNRIIKIIWVLIVVVGSLICLGLIVSIVCFALGKLSTDQFHLEFTAPGFKMIVNSKVFGRFLTPALLSIGLNALMLIVLIIYTLSQFRGIFSSFKDNNTPFTKINVDRMKRISYSFFIYSILIYATSIILKLLFAKSMPIGEISNVLIQFDTSLPLWPLTFGFLILGIAKVFDYGIRLQQDNDSIV